jgi:hypothetical protein
MVACLLSPRSLRTPRLKKQWQFSAPFDKLRMNLCGDDYVRYNAGGWLGDFDALEVCYA